MPLTHHPRIISLWNSGRKLRTVLIVPFVIQLFVAVGLVSYLSSLNGQKTTATLAHQLMIEVDTRINHQLKAYLEIPHTVNQSNEIALSLGELDPSNLSRFEKHFWRQRKIFGLVSRIQFGNEEGEFVGLTIHNNGSATYEATDKTGNLNIYSLTKDGNRGDRQAIKQNFQPQSEEWYQIAKNAGQSTWTYIDTRDPQMPLVLGQPHYDDQGELKGVLAATFTIAKISDFLHALDIDGSGRAFIIERNGVLVATSGPKNLVGSPNTGRSEGAARVPAAQSSDATTQAAAKFLDQKYDDLKTLTTSKQHRFKINGERHFIVVSPLRDLQGLNWLTVLVFPESDFIGTIHENNRLTLLLYLLSAFVAVWVGMITARWVTRPVMRMNQAARGIAAGNLRQQIPPSSIQELDELSSSFNEMAHQLQTSFDQMSTLNSALLSSEKQLADSNKNLEQKVKFQANELIQSEKMAALGQLTAGIAHEINTPLGVIQASSDNIETALVTVIQKLPALLQSLSDDQLTAFFALVSASHTAEKLSSSREERQLKKQFKSLLAAAEISPTSSIADTFSKMGLAPKIDAFLPILTTNRNVEILNVAYQLFIVHNNSDNIHTAIRRVSKIVFALKNYARHDLSKQMTKASIIESIETVLTLYHNQLKKGIEVVKNFREVPEIWCYPEELSQIWTNLIHNAIQAMDYQGHLVILAYSNKTHVFVEVVDSGVGIPEAIREQIFTPFFTTKPPGEGSGLGLDIVAQIIQKHQGEISVDSRPGRTIFQVMLPILDKPPPTDPKHDGHAEETSQDFPVKTTQPLLANTSRVQLCWGG